MPVPVASGAAYAYVAALLLSLAFAHFSPYDTPQILLTARQGTCTSNMFEKTEAQMEGPFYLKAVSRKDITENLPGAPLTLRLAVKGRDCKPFPEGATVSIWHAAVDGTYSGFVTGPNGRADSDVDATGEDYMRGEQKTDADGIAEFKTIIPGWYVGRPVHIHVKVLYEGGELTTQIYFPEETIAAAAKTTAYRARGLPQVVNEDESVPEGLIQKPIDNGDGTFSSDFSIGIDVDVATLSSVTASAATDAPSTSGKVGTEAATEPGTDSTKSTTTGATTTATSPVDRSDSEDNSACFPGDATVLLESGRTARMDQLSIGDRVSVGRGQYSEVFMFTHKLPSVMDDFVSVRTVSGASLSLSPGHYLYADNRLIAASALRIGASLTLETGANDLVVSVTATRSRGLYNPQTLTGNIAVQGVLVSCYTTAVSPSLAHAALVLPRLGYKISGGRDLTCGASERGIWKPLASMLSVFRGHSRAEQFGN